MGVKPALLLLHGVTRCGADFSPIAGALRPRWRIVAPDQRGHGVAVRAASYLVTDYVADAVKLAREPVVIHGHSLGAMVAAAVAAELPGLVRGVVLEDPPFHTMGARIHGTPWQEQFIGMRDVARAGGSVEQMTDALAAVRVGTHTLGEVRDRSALRWSAECLERIDPEVLTPIIAGRWLDGYDLTAIAARIRCPVLLLQGDPAAGGTLSDDDACLFPAARIERFPGTGHQIHWLEPARVAALVNDFP